MLIFVKYLMVTQNLDEKEIVTVWNKAKTAKIYNLEKELKDYTKQKNDEIEKTKKLTAKSMLEDGKPMDLKQFKVVFNSLNMNHDEMHKFWIETKKNEIKGIQEMINVAVEDN
jgi:hypothetical protein